MSPEEFQKAESRFFLSLGKMVEIINSDKPISNEEQKMLMDMMEASRAFVDLYEQKGVMGTDGAERTRALITQAERIVAPRMN